MNPEQVRTLQASFDRMWPVNKRIADLFYDRLFAIAPHTRALFGDDVEPQKMKFMGMLASAIGLIERQDMFESQLAELGRRHTQYGVTTADYAPVGEALLWSLEQVLGPDFDDETRAAWAALYASACDIMIRASRHNERPSR